MKRVPPAIAISSAPGSSLRVLHVLEATLGGTLRYMENIAECLDETDLSLGFAYATARADSRLEPLLAQLRRRDWKLYPVPMRREIHVSAELESVRNLRRVLQEFRPDVIHCHSSKAGVLGRVASLLVRPSPAVVYSPHALAIPLGRKYLYIERLLRKLAARFVAVSDSEAADIVRYELAAPDRVSVAYPLIDCDYFAPSANRNTTAGAAGPFTVMGVGRLTAQKDPLRFIAIVRRLQEIMPAVKGVWIGDGELRKEFDQLATLRPGAIRLVPWQRDIRPYLSAADVLLSTSRYESFGYMVAEALALEVPVVASRISGTSDILIGEFAANMYEPGDDGGAAALLKRVLQEPARAREWSASARAMIRERFNSRLMQEALLGAYSRAVGAEGKMWVSPNVNGASELDRRFAPGSGRQNTAA
jgi:glycosyltransferase involved in cell wall biosynthesis